MALLGRISMCLDSSSILPTDVRFVFKGEGGIVKEVKAQKLILAIASDVFEREFYGTMKEAEEDIEIKDASQEVFMIMIKYIYNTKIEWADHNLRFLSSLYYLGEKYNIVQLRKDIIASITEYEVSLENVLDVAILAEENIVHADLSESLYKTAASFLVSNFGGMLDPAIEFFSQIEESELHGLVVLKLMARMRLVPSPICENCQQEKIFCLENNILFCSNN